MVANENQLSDDAKALIRLALRMPAIDGFPRRSPHFIYFIGSARGPVKIGVSCNPLMRLRQLQTSTADKLRVLAAIPGSFEEEKYLHGFYQRERLTGEWFRRSNRLREFIACLNDEWFDRKRHLVAEIEGLAS